MMLKVETEVANKLREEAAKAGVPVTKYANQLLEKALETKET